MRLVAQGRLGGTRAGDAPTSCCRSPTRWTAAPATPRAVRRPRGRPAGWVNDPDPIRDYRLNILRLHDDRNAGSPTYAGALAANGYCGGAACTPPRRGGKPILCAAATRPNALATTGYPGVPQLTTSVHFFHAHVTDPSDRDEPRQHATTGRRVTAATRGRRRSACAAPWGAPWRRTARLAMQCQSCHGTMSAVGAPAAQGWLDEPACQSCHTGTAAQNNGQIRYTRVFDASGQRRVAANQTFATTANMPAAGFSLYRFSTGHGGLKCEACHGSTHAEFPSTHANDNVESLKLQGHVGVLAECTTLPCHGPGDRERRAARHAPGRPGLGEPAQRCRRGRRRRRVSRATAPTTAARVLSPRPGRPDDLGVRDQDRSGEVSRSAVTPVTPDRQARTPTPTTRLR